MKDSDIHRIIRILTEECRHFEKPIVTKVSEQYEPFRVLISTVLSARTRDKVTGEASMRLFECADTPEGIAELPVEKIRDCIYPVGFYKTKAVNIRKLCRQLTDEFGGGVPDEIDELLKLPGVGRKTANLVVTLAFRKPGICVDTHVHRISNRLGYVDTRTPEQTEYRLRDKLPRKYWPVYNDLLVAYGQNVCRPVRPLCEQCRLVRLCAYGKKQGAGKKGGDR